MIIKIIENEENYENEENVEYEENHNMINIIMPIIIMPLMHIMMPIIMHSMTIKLCLL